MIYFRNTDPNLQPSTICKELFVKSAIREDGKRVVAVEYENSQRKDGYVECYVFGNSMILSTLDESYVAPISRGYFTKWYRRCDEQGNLLDI